MRLEELEDGSAAFLDANVFVYHFTAEPRYAPSCTDLLRRVASGEITGWVSSHVLAEVAHRLMTIEACARFDWPYQGIASRLDRHPDSISDLDQFQRAVLELVQYGFEVAEVMPGDVAHASAISRQHGLLTNDSLIVALMRKCGLTCLASNDAQFDRVDWIRRYVPG